MATHPGSPDESFAGQGAVEVPPAIESELVFRAWSTALADARILFVGTLAPPVRFQLRRITPQGEADETFGPGGTIDVPGLQFMVRDGLLQEDGGVVVCGLDDHLTLARFTSQGALDLSFGNDGVANAPPLGDDVGSIVGRMVELPGGHLLVHSRGPSGSSLRRFTGDGRFDTSFGDQGVVLLGPTMLLGPMIVGVDGIYVPGAIGSNALIARYDFQGRLDPSFGVDGHFTFTPPEQRHQANFRALTAQEDGKLVAGGAVGVPNGALDGLIVRITASGELDPTFNDGQPLIIGLRVESTLIWDIVIEEDGRIVAVADSPHPSAPVLFRLESSGAVDRNFGDPNIDGSPGRRGWTYVAKPWPSIWARIFRLALTQDDAVLAMGEWYLELPYIRAFVAKHRVGPW